jgi:hypothetical protein
VCIDGYLETTITFEWIGLFECSFHCEHLIYYRGSLICKSSKYNMLCKITETYKMSHKFVFFIYNFYKSEQLEHAFITFDAILL